MDKSKKIALQANLYLLFRDLKATENNLNRFQITHGYSTRQSYVYTPQVLYYNGDETPEQYIRLFFYGKLDVRRL